MRRAILRADALFLGVAASAGLICDLRGIVLSRGPQARLLLGSPLAGIGFVEAHGLALILAVLLWRAAPSRSWHVTGAAVHLLLGISNLAFWQSFEAAGIVPVGIVTTALHAAFTVLQARAAMARDGDGAAPPRA